MRVVMQEVISNYYFKKTSFTDVENKHNKIVLLSKGGITDIKLGKIKKAIINILEEK